MSKPKVTIIVPTLNEAKSLPFLLPRLWEYGDEVLVVDGHSTDGTRDVAEQLGARVILDHGKGKGDAIRTGISEAQGDILVFIDADCSHDPADIPKLLAPIVEGKADHVSGSRMLGGSEELFSDLSQFVRLIGQQILTLGVNYRFGVRLTDIENGFRAARREMLLQLDLRENSQTIEQEMVIKTLRRGFRLIEVPTHEYKRRSGQSKIALQKVWLRFIYAWLKYMFF